MSVSAPSVTDVQWYAEVPRSVSRHVLVSMLLMVVSFGGFGAWAFLAPLAAAVVTQGSFVATGQNKIVQHLEGGIIKDIMVSEGDTVNEGQLLMRLDRTASFANERELFLRQTRLEAMEARLQAENGRAGTLVFPAHLEAARSDIEIASILDSQLLTFRVTQTALLGDLSLLERNVEAMDIRKVGYTIQLASHRRQLTLLSEELDDKNDLLEQGLVRRSEANALKRAVVEAEGQIGRLEAEIGEIEQVRRKYLSQMDQAIGKYQEAALNQLQSVQAELDGIREQSRTAQNVLARTEVVAPVSGVVVRLYYHTAGGVVESGRPIVEILPGDQPLIIETQIPRVEIDSVQTGQLATVRLSALNRRTTPLLEGKVFYVSADAIADVSPGSMQEVYLARISISPDQMRLVHNFKPTPGMPTEIMIQTTERTFAQYLAKPIKDSMIRAFRER
ncbi:HlyD family type I secretion periplasmic adaptor subunit [Tabrizicola sp. WMC-M-20]|nr:HlyD family type I secretion periplasmic adaptor subunit [Tabrizicola sp. WMC-M-20]